MPRLQAAPLLLGILVGLVVGLTVYGAAHLAPHSTRSGIDPITGAARDNFMIALLALACFALGVFATYAVFLFLGAG